MLDAEQIRQFHRDGFLHIPRVVKGAELDALQAAASRVAAEGMRGDGTGHGHAPIAKGEWGDPPGTRPYQTAYFRSSGLWERDAIFRAVTANPSILAIVAQCMGHPFLPANDSLVCKPGGANIVVPWHQDPPYEHNPALNPEIPDFDIDIFLDECTQDTGALWVLPGRHLEGSIRSLVGDCRDLFGHPDARAIEAKPGDVLVHALTLPHGSLGNRGSQIRRILYLHYMAEENFRHNRRRWSHGSGDVGNAGFSIEMVHAFIGMAAARDALKLTNDYERFVRLTEEGLSPLSAWTPPRHWKELRRSSPAVAKLDTIRGLEAS